MKTVLGLLPILPLLLTATAGAAAPAAERTGFMFGMDLGWAKMAMGDINELVQGINEEVGEDILEDVTGGVEFGLKAGYLVSPTLTVGLGFVHLDASTANPDPLGAIEIRVPADILEAWIHYLPPGDGKVRYGLGGGIGSLSAKGDLVFADPGEGVRAGEFSGSTLAAQGFVILDYASNATLGLQLHVGYRYAKLGSLELEGAPTDSDLDYSGLLVRLGIRMTP